MVQNSRVEAEEATGVCDYHADGVGWDACSDEYEGECGVSRLQEEVGHLRAINAELLAALKTIMTMEPDQDGDIIMPSIPFSSDENECAPEQYAEANKARAAIDMVSNWEDNKM